MRNEVFRTKAMLWIARRMPRWLAYWCSIRVGAAATTGKYEKTVVPDLLFMDALKRWDGTMTPEEEEDKRCLVEPPDAETTALLGHRTALLDALATLIANADDLSETMVSDARAIYEWRLPTDPLLADN